MDWLLSRVKAAVGAGFTTTMPELVDELELEELLLELEELLLELEELLLELELELELFELLELLDDVELGGGLSEEPPPPELQAASVMLSNKAKKNLEEIAGIAPVSDTRVCMYFVNLLLMARFP